MSAEVVMLRWIDVEHACEDGYHEFTSPQVPGFYIVSNDLEVAYADIPAALAALSRIGPTDSRLSPKRLNDRTSKPLQPQRHRSS